MLSAYRVKGTVKLGNVELTIFFDEIDGQPQITVVSKHYDERDRGIPTFGFLEMPELPLTEDNMQPVLDELLRITTEEEAESLLRKLIAKLKEMSSTPVEAVPNFFTEGG